MHTVLIVHMVLYSNNAHSINSAHSIYYILIMHTVLLYSNNSHSTYILLYPIITSILLLSIIIILIVYTVTPLMYTYVYACTKSITSQSPYKLCMGYIKIH